MIRIHRIAATARAFSCTEGILAQARDIPRVLNAVPCRTLTGPSRSENTQSLRRSYLYVPSSSDKMLAKSRSSSTDVVIYDLEDSVAPAEKDGARECINAFLKEDAPAKDRIAIRVNDITTPQFERDVEAFMTTPATILVLPKVHNTAYLDTVSEMISSLNGGGHFADGEEVRIVASVESAQAMWNLRDIVSWKSKRLGGGRLSALLFAAEDYCADTGILRSGARTELLCTRSQIVLAAKAFGLEAIDMVCVNYKDAAYLEDECRDGRALGFTGKQAIHPTQVETINGTFVPTAKEIMRAAKIVHQMAQAHASQKGAFGLELEGKSGGREMIDAPMLKQAQKTLEIAKAARLEIPSFD